MTLLSDQDARQISAAISNAERKTSGEIVAVVADQSSSYSYVPFMWAALAALLVPWPLIHFTWMKVQWIFLIQLAVFAILLAVLWPRAARMYFVPQSVRNAHVRRRATEQFLVQNLHTTDSRTGVLIFVSVAERHAEILADKGIDTRVEPGTWQRIVEKMTVEFAARRPAEGFIVAIKEIGVLLAEHFPPGSSDPNELPDHLIVLRTDV